jgi:ABC-type transport system involved in multi-copper enzyme maturation permease subunit
MPLAIAVLAGDSVAGEAGYGTLRYLLAAPAGRARILAVKYAVIAVFGLTVTFLVAAVALATGVAWAAVVRDVHAVLRVTGVGPVQHRRRDLLSSLHLASR